MSSKFARPSSPVHVHVDKDTPVHLYVDKDNNAENEISIFDKSTASKKSRRPRKPGYNVPIAKLMKNHSKPRVRSVSPPWIPPPGKSTKINKNGLGPFWNENEANMSQQDVYERQINDLLEEVGELRDQLEAEKYNDPLYESKQERDMEEKETSDNNEDETREEAQGGFMDPDRLIESLIETELSVQRCDQQINHLMDNTTKVMRENHKVTQRDKERVLAMQEDTGGTIQEFQEKAHQLREILEEWQTGIKRNGGRQVLNVGGARGHGDNTSDGNADKEVESMRREIKERDELIEQINRRLCDKEKESLGYNTTQEALEQMRGHLQQQLRQRSGDCNRMAVQIRSLENDLAKERLDKEQLLELLHNPRGDKMPIDRDTIKRAAKAQKQRALKAEEAVQELSSLLAEKERQIEQLMKPQSSNSASAPFGNVQELQDKSAQCEIDSHEDQLKIRNLQSCAEENDYLRDKLHNNPSEQIVISLKKENDNLRSIADECEAKLRQVEKEMEVLRENIGEESEDQQQNDEQITKLSNLVNKLEKSEKANSSQTQRINELEKRNRVMEQENKEMKRQLNEKDSGSVDNRCRLDELTKENASLMRQLETALTDGKRSSEKSSAATAPQKDRTLQSRLHDLETQLVQQRSEASKWRRNCEDAERKSEMRLEDVKLQLEQAERTNHSLNTYVQFLKKSYANVFGDVAPGSSGPIPANHAGYSRIGRF